jgi:hypothetical protein
MFIGYTEAHASNVYVFFNLNNQAIFMSPNVVWLHKLFHQHMKTKSALIPGFNVYDVSPTITNTQPIPPAIAPTIAPAPIIPRLTRTVHRIFTPPSISASDNNDDDDFVPVPPPTPHAPFDMHDTNAPLTLCYHVSYVTWRHFIIQSQVMGVTLPYLHMMIILMKLSYLLILIKTLIQILRLLVMM